MLRWLIFLPLILAPVPPYHGLALADTAHPEDVQALGAEWFYNWGATADNVPITAEFVPMLWRGNPSPYIQSDYDGWLLVFNEPNLTTQSNLSPTEAVIRFNALRAYYPRARLICCGVSIWAGAWQREFYALGGRPDAWHVHTYIEQWVTVGYIQSELTALHALTGGDYWVTEYGSMDGNLHDFKEITEWFEGQPWIARIAAYTKGDSAASWAIGVELVNDDGSLTPIGAWCAER
jgi:hypothetical protein